MPLAPAAQNSFTKWLAMIAENDFRDLPSIIAADAVFPLATWHKALSGTRPGVPTAQHSGGCFRGFQYHREFLDGENAALEFRASEPRQCDGRVDRAASESVICSRVTGMAT
jgi:hypothetical protein